MTLIAVMMILTLGAFLAWGTDRLSVLWSRWITLVSIGLSLLISVVLIGPPSLDSGAGVVADSQQWWLQLSYPWISRFGIGFTLAIDGLSYLLLLLTLILGAFSVMCSWSEITHKVGFFHFNLLLTLVGIIGVFTALDLFLFFCFWEVMLVPMVLLISVWGHEKRAYAAIKFFIFTQASSLLMLISIVALVLFNFEHSGELTFDYRLLLGTPLEPSYAMGLMLGFFIAFAVKIPVVPGHTWLPDAHTQAPTAGSVILAAVLLKTGAYGLIRFTLPLFPQASVLFAPVAMLLAVIGILYGAKLAFAQTDIKRFIAYSSISHMGFVLLGIYAMSAVAMQGAILQMIAHGISTAALFMLAGMIQERMHSRNLDVIGGLSESMPKLAAFGLFFAVASLGLPGLANFAAEFLVLLGSFATRPVFAVVAALGLVAAAIYSLALLQRTFWGQEKKPPHSLLRDLNIREAGSLLVLALALVFFGLHPQILLNNTRQSVETIMKPLLPIDQHITKNSTSNSTNNSTNKN
jgi:NADH-quinone oxidoreductase subunit M